MKDGKMDGITCFYYPDGSYAAKSSFKSGVQDGLTEVFYQNGGLERSHEWKEGKLHGWVREYYPNGQLKSEVEMRRGCSVGEYRMYSSDGELIQKETYDENGKSIHLWYVLDKEKNIITSGPSAIFEDERDTVAVGDTFKTTVKFGYNLKGVVKMLVASSLNQNGEFKDTLAVVELNSEGNFVYSFIANDDGKKTLDVVFSHTTLPGDTLSVDGLKVKHIYYVKERDKH